jgi:phosphoenolpyruvate---glycerone phosphotransferase subunit DhaL
MLTKDNALEWIRLFSEEIIANKELLSELDTPIGDGDHGYNMARGLQASMDALQATPPATLADVFKTVSMQLISKVGGASGPLYGSAFMGMIKAVGSSETLDHAGITQMIQGGLDMIVMRGKATTGEKTMVDVWTPCVNALGQGMITEEQITQWVDATTPMKATKGRASYLGERSIGHIDPGSYSSGLFFKTMLRAGVLA